MRVFIELAYDGTRYHGWQRQPQSITVQEVLEDTLARLFGGPCPVMGCGRTDTGVHAQYFVAHAESETAWRSGGGLGGSGDEAQRHGVTTSGSRHPRRRPKPMPASTRQSAGLLDPHAEGPLLEGRSTGARKPGPEGHESGAAHLVQKGDFASFCKAGSPRHDHLRRA